MSKDTKQKAALAKSEIKHWLKTEPYSLGPNGEILKFRMLGYDEDGELIEEVFEPDNRLIRRTHFSQREDGQFQMYEMVYFYYKNEEYFYHLIIHENGEISLMNGFDNLASINDICEKFIESENEEKPEEPQTVPIMQPSETIPKK